MPDRDDTQSSSLGTADTELAKGTPEPEEEQEETPGPERSSSEELLRDIARIDEAPPHPAELVGKRLAHFQVTALLGRGGMGVVYLAADLRLGRDVALKLIRGGDARLAPRLLREARAQARVDHPGVCKVFEVGEVEGKAYIAMERIAGRPLGEAAEGMSLAQKVMVVRDVARALHAAHTLGIVHRDVKPSNVLVETQEDGALRPVVMDFGIARDEDASHALTETGAVIGTPAYMSPEQARGDARGLDRRSDVYSLGATFYELLVGAPPFGGSPMGIVHAVLNDEPPPLRARARSVPEDLETIVAKCLRKEPGERYDSARALAEDLDRYLRGEPILGRRESVVALLRRRARKHRALVLMGALALCAVVAAGGLAVRARVVAGRHAAELSAEAELGRELGEEVKEMEWFLRAAKQLPLHDLTREREVVKEKMKRLEARAAAGPMAAAMVDYAVGRGHLALDEDKMAVERLERAERGGLDTPELHYALGLARGRLYRKALFDAHRPLDARSNERRQRKIEEQYLKPAVASMEKSKDVRLEAPSYLPGLLAFYRKDYEEALRLAQKAHEEAPWFYDAVELQADVLLARSIERERRRGERDDAAREMEEAARLYDTAAESGRSDWNLYEGSAVAWKRRMEMDLTRTSPEDSLARALDRCEKAAAARPDQSGPYFTMADALGYMAQHLLAADADPRPIVARELAAVDRARAAGGDRFRIYTRRAGALGLRAQYETQSGLDPTASIDQAIDDARHAVDLAPAYPQAYSALGFNVSFRAIHARNTGGDPEPDLRTAIDAFRQAYTLDGSFTTAYFDVISTYGEIVYWKATHGRDPSDEATQAAGALAACTRANANESRCYEGMVSVDLGLAEHRIAARADAREALSRALEHAEKERTLTPDTLHNDYHQLGRVHLLRAKDAINRGEAPAPALEAFSQVVADCYRLDPKDQDCTFLDARRSLLLADIDACAHRPERPSLDRALTLAQLAVERNPRNADAYQVLADVSRRLAALPSPAAEQAKHRAKGIDACARGLAVNPNHPRLLAAKGALLLLEAHAAPDAAAKAESARQARDALRRAVELNPLLRREVGPLLDEAEHLSG